MAPRCRLIPSLLFYEPIECISFFSFHFGGAHLWIPIPFPQAAVVSSLILSAAWKGIERESSAHLSPNSRWAGGL
jgi:hypothetical protein